MKTLQDLGDLTGGKIEITRYSMHVRRHGGCRVDWQMISSEWMAYK
ncbi:hypothetical protein JIN85_17950 [Luteolibacter pohnpeiensis]|uniref:Uncharacterized protein n=1 Tax=Luteolibacter pohnpeiensis TaxID=454153 RepID=A0A934S9I5_9BACT|nr:hypothetical protein [Luteolibacter pohnpeiensis]MBK1884308.1 hypothetical protein [Luteolibacter pohnpeiensis]